MRAIAAEDQPFVREDVGAEEALRRLVDQPFKREIVEGLVGEEAAGDVAAGSDTVTFYRNDGWEDLCLGPHLPSTGPAGGLSADRGLGRLLARRREEPAAHPDLRHGLGDGGRSRRPPGEARGGRAARSPQARHRSRPVLVPRGDRLGARRLPPARRHGATDHGGLLPQAPRGAVPLRQLAAHHEAEPVRHQRAPAVVRGRHVPADGARRRHRVLPEADELPVPRADLQGAHTQLPGAADAAVRVRLGLPLREVRRGPRAHARARHDAGRRAHLHDPRADGGGARRLADVHPVAAPRLRARGFLSGALDQARGEGGRLRRGVGRGHRGAPASGARDEPRAGDGPGGRRVLRAEDQRAGARRDRPHLADVDDPARLPDAAAFRSALRRRRRQAAPADHDPPGAVRIDRAVLRGADRALRGRVPAVARARAAAPAAGGRPQRRGGAPSSRRGRAPPGSGWRWTTRSSRSARRSEPRSC